MAKKFRAAEWIARAGRAGTMVVAITCLFSPPNAGAEATLFVQSLKAPLYAEPRLGSAVVGEAKQGESLQVGTKQGNWHPVRHHGKDGWVAALLLGEKPPPEKISLLNGQAPDLAPDARRRASAFTTAAAARGLQEAERRRSGNRYQTPDFARLEKVEQASPSAAEALEFLQGGPQR